MATAVNAGFAWAVFVSVRVTVGVSVIVAVAAKKVADGLAHVATWNAAMIVTDDLGEGLAAQMQKRPPQYADLLAPKKLD